MKTPMQEAGFKFEFGVYTRRYPNTSYDTVRPGYGKGQWRAMRISPRRAGDPGYGSVLFESPSCDSPEAALAAAELLEWQRQ